MHSQSTPIVTDVTDVTGLANATADFIDPWGMERDRRMAST